MKKFKEIALKPFVGNLHVLLTLFLLISSADAIFGLVMANSYLQPI